MSISRIALPCLSLCILAAPAVAQMTSVVVKPQPDSPIQITNGECSATERGIRCKATLTVSPVGLWTAYGLKWKLTYEDGQSKVLSSVADVSLLPEISGGAFKPGEVREHQTNGFSVQTREGKELRLVSAEAEMEFVAAALGKPWGNTKSVNYSKMMAARDGFRQAMDYLRSIYSKQGKDAALKALGVPPQP